MGMVVVFSPCSISNGGLEDLKLLTGLTSLYAEIRALALGVLLMMCPQKQSRTSSLPGGMKREVSLKSQGPYQEMLATIRNLVLASMGLPGKQSGKDSSTI